MKISQLKGLGKKSEECLKQIGILNADQLAEIGAVAAYYKMGKTFKENGSTVKLSLNFLYAMEGGLQNISWQEIARTQRESLIRELEALELLEQLK